MEIVDPHFAEKTSPDIQDCSHSVGNKHEHPVENDEGMKESPPEDPMGTEAVVESGPTGDRIDPEKVLTLPSGTIVHLYKENKFSGKAIVLNVNGAPEIYLGHKKDHLWKTRPLRVFEKSLLLQGASGVPYVDTYGDGRPWILTTQHPSGMKVLARADGYPVIFKSKSGACNKAGEILSFGIKAKAIGLGGATNCIAIFEDEDWCSEKLFLLNFSAFHKVFLEEDVPAEKGLWAKVHFRKDPKTGKLISIRDYQASKLKHPDCEHITFEKGEKVQAKKGSGLIIGYDKNERVLRIKLDDGSYASIMPRLVEHLEKKQEGQDQQLPRIEEKVEEKVAETKEPEITAGDIDKAIKALGAQDDSELNQKWEQWVRSMHSKNMGEDFLGSQLKPSIPPNHIAAYVKALYVTGHKEALKNVYGALKAKVQTKFKTAEEV